MGKIMQEPSKNASDGRSVDFLIWRTYGLSRNAEKPLKIYNRHSQWPADYEQKTLSTMFGLPAKKQLKSFKHIQVWTLEHS